MTDTPENESVIRPFADFLREQAKGSTHDDLSVALHDLISRVRDTGKGGSLQLTLTVKPFKKDTDTLVVADAIRVKLPEHDRKESIFYADRHGNLSRNDPNQLDFSSLREVGAADDAEVVEPKAVAK